MTEPPPTPDAGEQPADQPDSPADQPDGPADGPTGRPATPPVQYKGADLDPARGPGLGCFWIQIALFVVFVALTPLSVSLGWPSIVSAALLIVTLGLLFFAGQTVIFLLRLVAADRREGRRRPLASATRTVGELEDERRSTEATADPGGPSVEPADEGTGAEPSDHLGQGSA